MGGPTVQTSHLSEGRACSCRDSSLADRDGRVFCPRQGLCMLKERAFHLVDSGERRVTTLFITGGRLVRERVASLLATMVTHSLARGSVLVTGEGKYVLTEVLVLFKLLGPPIHFPYRMHSSRERMPPDSKRLSSLLERETPPATSSLSSSMASAAAAMTLSTSSEML